VNSNTPLFAGRTCSGRLWTDHPATPKQAQLTFKLSRRRARPTQADVIVELLRGKRAKGRPLELPEIMAAGIAQHGARMKELRQRGFVVRNEMERSSDGCVLSRYWLEHDPERDGQP
jgi:hypothetical protein